MYVHWKKSVIGVVNDIFITNKQKKTSHLSFSTVRSLNTAHVVWGLKIIYKLIKSMMLLINHYKTKY